MLFWDYFYTIYGEEGLFYHVPNFFPGMHLCPFDKCKGKWIVLSYKKSKIIDCQNKKEFAIIAS